MLQQKAVKALQDKHREEDFRREQYLHTLKNFVSPQYKAVQYTPKLKSNVRILPPQSRTTKRAQRLCDQASETLDQRMQEQGIFPALGKRATSKLVSSPYGLHNTNTGHHHFAPKAVSNTPGISNLRRKIDSHQRLSPQRSIV